MLDTATQRVLEICWNRESGREKGRGFAPHVLSPNILPSRSDTSKKAA